MSKTVSETIKENTRVHLLENNGLLLAQCVTAVGWIGGTVPELTEDQGIIELPICDSSGGGFAVGAALAGRRPIFIVRYQGFMWYDCVSLINYAAKSKEIWNVPCPVFIRAIAMEGKGIGPVASSAQYSMFMRPPGIAVCAPMTPNECDEAWAWYLDHDDPIYVSEHRWSYLNADETENIIQDDAKITLFAISAGRINAAKAVENLEVEGIVCDLIHLMWLKPFEITGEMRASLGKTGVGMVIDSDFSIAGASRSLAYDLMHSVGSKVYAMGLDDRSCGVSPDKENCTPSPEKIVHKVKTILGEFDV